MRAAFAIALGVAAVSAQNEMKQPRNGASALEVVELIDGVLIGALETEEVYSLYTCIDDVNPLVEDMVTAVNDFENPSYERIADGIYQLGQFISQVGVIMEDCATVGAEDVAQLEAMGEAFLHPKQLIIDAENNLIVNGVEIFRDIRQAGKHMQAGEYEQAGELYGTVGALVLWGQQNMAPIEVATE